MNPLSRVAMIGVGLIGGSIAKALKKQFPHLMIASLQRDCADLQQAVAHQTVDLICPDWNTLIEWSEWIILASPLSTMASLAHQIHQHCPANKNY
jgi:prephenate dehydrogenase